MVEWLRYKCVPCGYEGGARSTTKKPKCGKCGSRKLNYSEIVPDRAEDFQKQELKPAPEMPAQEPNEEPPKSQKSYIDENEDWV